MMNDSAEEQDDPYEAQAAQKNSHVSNRLPHSESSGVSSAESLTEGAHSDMQGTYS